MFPKLDLFRILHQNKYLVLLDQALLSIINFGSILVLAKTASIAIFGSFVVLYSYHLFVFLFSSLYISGPILIFLTKKWKNKEGEYLFSSLLMNTLLCFSLIVIAYFFLAKQINGVSFYHFFLMSFCVTFFQVLKKFVFSSKNIHVKYGLLSTLILNIVFFYGLFSRNLNDLSDILVIYWVSFFIADFILLIFIIKKGIFKTLFLNFTKKIPNLLKEVSVTHYHYAKWILLGGMAFWGYTQGIYILAKALDVSDFAIGKIRTIQNLLGVFNILAISFENHYTPIFSEKLGITGRKRVFSLIRTTYLENYKKIALLFILAIPIGLVFYNFLYIDKYGNGTIVFFIFLFIQFILICVKPFTIVLKCIEKTKSFFVSHLLAVIGMILTLLCVLYFSVYYAMPISIAIATLIYICVLFVFFNKGIKEV